MAEKFLAKLGLVSMLLFCGGCNSFSGGEGEGDSFPTPPPQLLANGYILNRVGTTQWPPPQRRMQDSFGFGFGNGFGDRDKFSFKFGNGFGAGDHFRMVSYGPSKWYDYFERDYTVPWPSSGKRRWVYVCVGCDENEAANYGPGEESGSFPKKRGQDEELDMLQKAVDQLRLKNEKIEQELEHKRLKKERNAYEEETKE
jgi:hypothetical protein